MKLLVIGCGSIGRRHAANAALFAEAAVFDRVAAAADGLGLRCFDDLAAALDWGADGVVVAVPHDAHIEVAARALEAGSHLLIEKPIAHQLAGLDDFLARAEALDRKVRVVCNMRFHPGPAALKASLAEIGRPLFARAQYGNYLPDMRPGADYRTLYCARAASGGGVILDAIHEIDYLAWLLGAPKSLTATAARLGDMDIDVEDYAALALAHADGARSEIHLDYLQRAKRRGCEIVGRAGTLVWLSEGKRPERCTVRLYRADCGDWQVLYEDPAVDADAPYRELMRRFAAAVAGEAEDGLLDGRTAAAELAVALAGKRMATADGSRPC